MAKPINVLIVEDSEDDALLLLRQLRRDGYEPEYDLVATAEGMRVSLSRRSWDLVIADYSLPRFSGLMALNMVRERDPDLPFIIVSGVIGEETAVEAMRAGAHDYLMKGNLARLAPAIEREVREAQIRKDRKRAEEALRENEKRFIAEMKESQERLRQSLQEKEVLLKEIHHRVKNNLQVVYSLLNLQSGYIRDPKALDMFHEAQNRVKSMAIVHDVLYHSEDLARVNFGEYIRTLMGNLFRSFGAGGGRVRSRIHVGRVHLDFDTAIPCGLLINELVSNSLKYAFPDGRSGEVFVTLDRTEGNRVVLEVGDDGVGVPEAIDIKNTQTLGLQLVTTLTQQLGGTITLDRSVGTRFTVTFTDPGSVGKELEHVGSTNSGG